MLDVSVVEFLLGLLLWYAAKDNVCRRALLTSQYVALVLGTSILAVWMWYTMSLKGGLGKIKYEAVREQNRVADEWLLHGRAKMPTFVLY